MQTAENTTISFGEFEIDSLHRRLSKRGRPVVLKPKAFDLLLTLIESRGEVVSKNDLLDRVWENQFVEENNLTVHVAALRKALGETKNDNRYIVTVPGVGYKFVAELRRPDEASEVVVETHSFETYSFDEEIEVKHDENGFASPDLQAAAIRSGKSGSWLTPAIAATVILAGLGIGAGLYLSKEPAANSANVASDVMPQVKSRVFTTTGGIPHRVVISPDGKSLAFVQRHKGQDTIWVADIESHQSIRVTEPSGRVHESLTFGPDGRSLYFTARDEHHPDWTLMRVSTFGGVVEGLTVGVNGSVTFSPDAHRMAFFRKDGTSYRNLLVTAKAKTGGDEQTVLRLDKSQRFTSVSPSWSPDGRFIAAGVTDEQGKGCRISAVDLADGSVNPMGEATCRGGLSLVWLRDGSGIVMVSGSDDGSGQVSLVSYPEGTVSKITNDTLNYSTYGLGVSTDDKLVLLQSRVDPALWHSETDDPTAAREILEGSRLRAEGMQGVAMAPDGKILFIARANDSRSVWEMKPDGSEQRQLTPTKKGGQDEHVSATADNRFIVFASDRSGTSEIWRANRDGSDLKQLTGGGRNSAPAVTPDGQTIIYASARDEMTTLWQVSIDGGEAKQLTTEETAWPDVSPDGKFIACAYGHVASDSDKRFAIIPIEGGPPVKIYKVASNGILYNRLRFSADGRAVIYKDIVQGLWRQDLDKDQPESLEGFMDIRVYHFAFSPDGKLVYSGGIPMREIVILENFR